MATCDALRALVATGRLAQAACDELIADYRYLRRVEHRLQMIDDEQTHTLPEDPDRLAHLARSEEHTSELQSLMRTSYAVFCLKKKNTNQLSNRLRRSIHNQNWNRWNFIQSQISEQSQYEHY